MTDFFKKHTLITGTLLLTATGFITRVLGFFYRIFLSRTIGAEGLGLYNMVHPIYGICFAVCAGSIQTAISRCVASDTARGKMIFRTGLCISLTVGCALAFLICRFSGPLASLVLMEEQCAPLLPVIAVSVPFSAVHACINGYYYGIQKTRVPALAQIAEQLIRMGAVFLIADILTQRGEAVTVGLAVVGHLIGEIASCLYTAFCFTFLSGGDPEASARPKKSRFSLAAFASLASPLMSMAIPLMGTRLVINVLSTAESIWIPNRLEAYGLTASQAFSIYGVLTGMSMPFILFPSAITNSMAVLLLPTVAEAQSGGQKERIAQTVSMSLRYSLYMGILCVGVFTLFGDVLGTSVFHNASAGTFMQILAWLCPFLYLSTTTGSILNGLGKTRTTFLQSAAALILRILFVFVGIPRFGITAYLWGMLVSEIFLAYLHLRSLSHAAVFSWNVWEMVLRPALYLALSVGVLFFLRGAFSALSLPLRISPFMLTALQAAFLSAVYGGLLLLTHLARREPAG